ncbi:hypothetical protein HYH03_005520 [Edaphochlamys debaryana]|uniref:RING-type domain-containing protein n=1 Tax=Edaphochlamys debaryana TaxID=47281 RepID=A0A836C1X7_9CHLO|nr:hypothetical protein HYH03_005520 [Edaphochlamys debaryana]|eukprot:KAG2496287.1 hypothetical protein HYH03_005520 [Edaphochlamys debaryana]
MGAGHSLCASLAVDGTAGGDGIRSQLEARSALVSSPKPLSVLGMQDSALHIACEKKNVQAARAIVEFVATADPPALSAALSPYCNRHNLLVPATNAEGVRLLLNMQNTKGQTALMYASYANCPELVRYLVQQGADPWVADRCGCRNALHYATIAGATECLKALLGDTPPQLTVRHGINYVDSRSLSGLTGLHYAIFYGHDPTVLALLAAEPPPAINAYTTGESYDVWVTCETLSTPLHVAALKDNRTAARALLLHYARRRRTGTVLDPRMRSNSAGELPYQVARTRPMATMLHPGMPLREAVCIGLAGADAAAATAAVVEAEEAAAQGKGLQTLAALAAAALRQKLLAEVEAVEKEVVTAAEMAAREAAPSRRGTLLCGTPRRRSMAGACGPGMLGRLTSGRLLRPAPSGAAPLPTSPWHAPTLDRRDSGAAPPHPADAPGLSVYGEDLDGGSPVRGLSPAPSLKRGVVNRSRPGSAAHGFVARADGGARPGRTKSGKLTAGPGAGPSQPGAGPSQAHGGGARRKVSLSGALSGALPSGPGTRTSHGGMGLAGESPPQSRNITAERAFPNGDSPDSTLYIPSGGFALPPTALGAPAMEASPFVAPSQAAAAAKTLSGPPTMLGGPKTLSGPPVVLGATPSPLLIRPSPAMPLGTLSPGLPAGGSINGSDLPLPGPGHGLPLGASISIPTGTERDAVDTGSPRRDGAGRALLPPTALGLPSAGASGTLPLTLASPQPMLSAFANLAGVPVEGEREGEVEELEELAGNSDAEDGWCAVCFARREEVAPAGCRHGLCSSCAAQLCRAVANKPLLCPFCRQPVSGFVRALGRVMSR